ncbi:MAG: NUDIX hydrolase [Planctomycetota bacterium]
MGTGESQPESVDYAQGDPIPQAAAIPYRIIDGVIEVMIVTANSGGWTIPKGLIDPGRTAQQMAEIEALEEAGVIGKAESEPIGEFRYEKFKGLCHVQVFPMLVDRVLDRWAEDAERSRRWVPIDHAAEEVRLPQMGEVIHAFAERERS